MKQEEEYIGLPNEVVNPSVVGKAEQHSEEEEEEEEEPLEEEEEEEPQEEEEEEQQRFHHQPHTGDGASPGKIFIGGLAKETTPVQFNKHFGKYGEITDSVIMKDRRSGQPRGFGFVTYADPAVVDKVIEETHVINGKQVEIKRTIPKGSAGSRDIKTKKIFVGGIPTSVAEDEFKDFFAKYGEVKEHMIMRDHATNRSRGFGFITFETEESVDDLLSKGNRIDLAGTQVEIKKAEPKKANPPPPPAKRFNDSRPAYGAVFGDSYGGYGGGAAAAGSGYGASSYRSGGGRPGAYGGYGGSEYGGAYGGYGGSGLGGYNRGEPPLGYASRYGGSYGRGYDLGGTYGGAGEGYGGYGGASVGGFGGTGTGTGTGTGAYDTSLGSGYGGGTGGSFYGSRGGYGGAAGRYHPYGR